MTEFIKKAIQPNGYVMAIIQLLLPVFLYIGITNNAEWYWWAMTVVFYFLYLSVGNNVGLHRYFCHRNFKLSKPMEHFVVWCGSMGGLGSPPSYISVHTVHHAHVDTELDPHGPCRGWRSVLLCFHRHIGPNDIIFTKTLKDAVIKYYWLQKYYWIIVGLNALVMYLISWKVFIFCWAIPASLTLWAVGFVLIMGHQDKKPSNTRSYQWFGWGEAWHKNHHDNPTLADHAPKGKIDWTYQVCKILSKSEK